MSLRSLFQHPLFKIRLQFFAMALLYCSSVSTLVFAQNDDQSNAQDTRPAFSLFEGIDSTDNRGRSLSRSRRESRATAARPEFVLVGTSRIGSKYSAILQHKGGASLRVSATPGGNATIPDHSGYTLINIGAGSVSIRYPGNNPCIEFRDLGVSCNGAGNVAELVLTNGQPLAARASNTVVAQVGNSAGATGSVENGGQEQAELVNPFAALRAAEASGRRAINGTNAAALGTRGSNRFSPRRIQPEDVPPGMRVVSTPFGDRLVEQ